MRISTERRNSQARMGILRALNINLVTRMPDKIRVNVVNEFDENIAPFKYFEATVKDQ
jgi:hypothetical protein